MSIMDAGALPRDAVLETDLCIIGSGAAGITLAHRLLTTSNIKRICVLESSLIDERSALAAQQLDAVQRFESTATAAAHGSIRDSASIVTWNPDHHRYEDRATQPLYQGQLSGPLQSIDPRFLLRSRVRVYGGTTNCWGGWTRPLSAVDFDRSDLHPTWVWPLSAAQLRPYYCTALEYCSLADVDPDDYERPDAWIGRTDLDIAVPPSHTGRLRTGVFSIMNGAGPLRDGTLAFQKVWGGALECAERVTLVRNANVRRLVSDPNQQRIVSVQAQALQRSMTPVPGVPFSVRAGRYVLASGGIETIRLLLLSGGIGNRAGHLGRNFMVHPLNERAGRLRLSGNVPPGVRNFFSNRPRLKGQAWPPRVFGSFVPTDAALRELHIGNFRANVDFNSGSINLAWEQTPNPASRIRLSETRDVFGDPEVWLDWQSTELEARTASTALALVVAEAVALGYASDGTRGHVHMTAAGDHHMGAARMSLDRHDGYVDLSCRAHEIDNLYIASSAVFPTGGVANPTLTIIALAVRLAEHLSGTAG